MVELPPIDGCVCLEVRETSVAKPKHQSHCCTFSTTMMWLMWLRQQMPQGQHSYDQIGDTKIESTDSGSATELSGPDRDDLPVRAALLCGAVLLSTVGLWLTSRQRPPGGGEIAALASREGLLETGSGVRKGALAAAAAEDSGHPQNLQRLAPVISLTNKYQKVEEELADDLLYPWEYRAEPATATRLQILSWPGRSDDRDGLEEDTYSYTWVPS